MKNMKWLVMVAGVLMAMSFNLMTREESTVALPYKLVEAFPSISINLPVELTSPDDNSNRIFVIAQGGVIHVFPNNAGVKKTGIFLDITKQLESGGEKGLLGLAFHPDYKRNGYFYVNYTRGKPLETVISRFKV